MDPIRLLMEHTERGFYSFIQYDKNDGDGPTERLIEPRQLAEGRCGILIRSLQVQPERGPRTFMVGRITHVRASDTPLSPDQRKRNKFHTAEIVEFATSDSSAWKEFRDIADNPTQELPRHGRGVWTSPWFREYCYALRDVLLDLKVNSIEKQRIAALQRSLHLEPEQIRAAHAYLIAEELFGFAADGWIDGREQEYIHALCVGLSTLGWSPISY